MNPHRNDPIRSQSPTLPLPPPEPPRPSLQRLIDTLSAEEIAALAEHLRQDPATFRTRPQTASAAGGQAAAQLYRPALTHADVTRNDLSLTALPPHLRDIEKFLPELQKKKPDQLLHTLSERFRADPSTVNATLLQHAVNRITSTGAPDSHLKAAITRAISVLHQRPDTTPPRTDDIFCWAYQDANFGGASIFADLVPGWVYWRIPYVGDSFNDQLSSLIITVMADEVAGNVGLFENANFMGRYQNYNVTVPSGVNDYVEEDVSYVGDDFNDITSSILITRRFANETTPVSIGALVPQQAVTDIVNAQQGVSSAGAPTFTWDMWPTGPTSDSDWHPNDPGKRFIYVIVPINVDTGTIFGTYSCQVRYWIYIYVDGSGNLQGYVDWYGCWVQGGWITGQVENDLMQKIPGTIPQVDNLVSQAMGLANIGAPYRFSYFLPGTNALTGSTWDDVTVVAVR
jgi:hypothetical protein